MTDSLNETPLLTNDAAGFRIFYRGKNLLPSNPQQQAIDKIQALKLSDETLFVVCSPLLWFGVDALMQKLPPKSEVILIEADSHLRQLIDWEAEFKNRGCPDRLAISVASEILTICFDISQLFRRHTRQITFLSLNGGRLINSNVYKEIQQISEFEFRRHWRNRTTLLYMGSRWMRNFFSHIANTVPHRDLSQFPTHPQVVICGAGPSIEAAVPLLRTHRSNIFLVAVDTALPILSAFGLSVDLVIALEGQIANLQDFIANWSKVPAIAYDLISHPAIPQTCRNAERWTFSSHFAAGKHWNRAQKYGLLPLSIPPLGSVGVCALYLAGFLSSNAIYIVGLDFGYKPGLTHARHSPAHQEYLATMSRLKGSNGEIASLSDKVAPGQGLNNQPILTDTILTSYRDSTNEVITRLQERGLHVYDLRTLGLPLNAQPVQPVEFSRLVEAQPNYSPQKANPCPDQTRQTQEFLAELVTDIDTCLATIQQTLTSTKDDNGQLLDMIADLDFLMYDIADADWPSLEPQALARAYVKLAYFRNYIAVRLNLRSF